MCLDPNQQMFAGRAVYCKGGPFIATQFMHALEVGWQGPEADKARFYNALAQEVAIDGQIAILDHQPFPFVLFTSKQDAEWALSSQPGGRCAGILAGDGQAKIWMHHPEVPYPQLLEYVTVEAMALRADRDIARRIFEEMGLFGEIGYIKWLKAPIDDRSPDEREEDDEEEAEMDLRQPRILMQYRVYYRSKSGFNCVERAADLPGRLKPAVLKRRFEVKSLPRWTTARPIVEKPHPPSTTNTLQPRRMRQRVPDSASTVLEPPETYAGVISYSSVENRPYDWSGLFANDEHPDVIVVKDAFAAARARAAAALARQTKRKGRDDQDRDDAEGSSKRVRS